MRAISICLFGAVIGLLWLAKVALASGLIAQIFSVGYHSTLTGMDNGRI